MLHLSGMVPLLPVSMASGGLKVIPRSHTEAAKAEPWMRGVN